MKFTALLMFLFGIAGLGRASAQEFGLKYQIEALDLSVSSEDVESAIIVQDANTGEVIYSRNPDLLLNPASNAKILTTLAALSFLSPEFRFKTQLIGDAKPKDGHLRALVLKGFGDPSFTSYGLEKMVRELKDDGIRSVGEVRIVNATGENFEARTPLKLL